MTDEQDLGFSSSSLALLNPMRTAARMRTPHLWIVRSLRMGLSLERDAQLSQASRCPATLAGAGQLVERPELLE